MSDAGQPRKSTEKEQAPEGLHYQPNTSDISVPDAEKAAAAPPTPWADPSAFPDGGAKAWLTVAGSAACLFVSFGWVNCVGLFQEYYQTNQLSHYSTSQVSWIPTLQLFFMLFGGPFVGKIFDYYGPAPLLAGGTFLHVFGLMMTSISKEYYQILLSQAVVSAIGASMVFYPAFTSTSTWFFKKRGMAVGLVTAGSSLGGVIFPVMVIKLLPQVGFGWTMRICAFLILGLLIFGNLTVRSRVAPTKTPLKLMHFVNPLKERTFALVVAAVFFFYWGMFIPFDFLVIEARANGMSSRLASYLVPILNAASIFGRTVPAALADKLGRFNVMIVMAALSTILILALWIPATENVPLILFAAFFGVSSGAGISLSPVICAAISPISEIGMRVGLATAIAAFAGLTGSPIAGKIVADDQGSFLYSKVFAGVLCGIGTALFVAARFSHAGTKGGKV